ncbi:MAG: HaeIII family restriction endonuclease [Sedimentibacter sp.]
MAIQSKNGKAYEYACLIAFKNYLENVNNIVEIIYVDAVSIAQKDYESLNIDLRKIMDKAAMAAVRVIARLEPMLQNSSKQDLLLTLQPDKAGKDGDVRDIIAIRKDFEWEIGISCKHNHDAVKHSRLSKSIDFGEKWLQIPCSKEYFNDIAPIFDKLTELKDKKIEWKAIKNKNDEVYVPILNSFAKELKRLEAENPKIVPERFLSYLIGRNDFYKVISEDRKKITKISAFNIYGTLNRSFKNIKPQTIAPKLIMPTKFYDISYKQSSKNTIITTCDNGWTISMRIHSASTLVESSLKFDVNLVGIPQTLYTQHEPW